MLKLTLMSKHNHGCCAMELFRDEHGGLTMTVWDMAGGPQFDFELDESDAEILSVMARRAMATHPTDPGQGGDDA